MKLVVFLAFGQVPPAGFRGQQDQPLVLQRPEGQCLLFIYQADLFVEIITPRPVMPFPGERETAVCGCNHLIETLLGVGAVFIIEGQISLSLVAGRGEQMLIVQAVKSKNKLAFIQLGNTIISLQFHLDFAFIESVVDGVAVGVLGVPVNVSEDLAITEDGFIDVVEIYRNFKSSIGFDIFRNPPNSGSRLW